MSTKWEKIIEKYHLKQVTFSLHIINAIIHVILTNLPGETFEFTKVLLMPLLCLFFLVSVLDLKQGWYVAWALCGLWLGNICLIWGEESRILFILGSAFTIIGFMGYIRVLMRPIKTISATFVFFQMPIIWICAFFVFFMQDALGVMLIPIALYMTLIAIISILGLGQLLTNPDSTGAKLMFVGTLFYIAENGLYTADHYMSSYTFGENIVHPCFILAQTLIVCGYLMREREVQAEHTLN